MFERRQSTFVAVIFIDLRKKCSQFLNNSFRTNRPKYIKVDVIPNTTDKNISVKYGRMKFLDSYSFLNASLDNSTNFLAKENSKITNKVRCSMRIFSRKLAVHSEHFQIKKDYGQPSLENQSEGAFIKLSEIKSLPAVNSRTFKLRLKLRINSSKYLTKVDKKSCVFFINENLVSSMKHLMNKRNLVLFNRIFTCFILGS